MTGPEPVLVFKDPPMTPKRRAVDTERIAELLRQRPNEWARVKDNSSNPDNDMKRLRKVGLKTTSHRISTSPLRYEIYARWEVPS